MRELAPQHKALRVIYDDHDRLGAVLHGMLFLLRAIRDGGAPPDLKVFRAMLFYIRDYPDAVHHAKEDRFLFARLRMRTHAADAVLDELERQHADGDALIRKMEHALARYELEGDAAFPAWFATAESYAKFYFDHMRMEEETLLPLAQRSLTPEDWTWIDQAFLADQDPLAGYDSKGSLDRLFSLIVHIAPPPIGLGPAPKTPASTRSGAL
ncbi:hemerythrin domain-containing protein [Oxalobacteraceae bacterium OM1]|nr:hemerythrin domain-containing protein [Oxalobacteraceae bacterium OM1]